MNWTKKILAGIAAAPFLLVALAPPVAGQEAPSTLEERQSVTFAVVDNGELPRDGRFDFEELEGAGLAVEDIEASVAGEDGASADDTAQQNPYEVVESWNDVDGDEVTMRAGRWTGGDSGFGEYKVEQKHNLGTEAVRIFTQNPDSLEKDHQSGTSYTYSTTVLQVECSWWFFCDVVDQQPTTTVVNFRDARGAPFGVVTSYCDGVQGHCPDWVRNVLA